MKSNKYVYASSSYAHAYIGKMEGSVHIKSFHKVNEKGQQACITGRERKKFLVHKTKDGTFQSALLSIREIFCIEASTCIFLSKEK